jgi:hypothetical protein
MEMKTIDELKEYRNDLGATDDEALCKNLDRLISGDETVRGTVEAALDLIDEDLARIARYERRHLARKENGE